ncbi:hypothetical protein [Saccharothrix coeruleofusca]|uniref:Uncharacterized protein n=1 Tax=Saccharothrix coeruleofusca TaxID=33919 RepID=A0A918EI99_9PSEU|nr:hypothetical protein [Saccharothrix coeruleofusca]GGP82707.1 hypothetical protein GCM10010185_65930 [Saccharothrix coeruleofusca]
MTGPQQEDGGVERGDAEESSGVPLTETEREVSQRPPSDSPDPDDQSSG